MLLTASCLSHGLALVVSPIESRGAPNPSIASLLARTALEARAPECRRDMDQIVSVAQSAFTGQAQLAYTIAGGGITNSVCSLVNHYAQTDHPCVHYALIVALTVGSIIESQKSLATPIDGTKTSERREITKSSMSLFVGNLDKLGFNFGHVETPAIERRDGEEEIAEHFIVRNFQHPDTTITPADVYFKSYTNGTGFMIYNHDVSVGNGTLGKRHNGAGFKYNWHCGYWEPKSQDADINAISFQLGAGIANNWAIGGDNYALDQAVYAAGIDYILLKLIGVAIRIIPELRGFGEEYEDVNICGDMTQPIHDELR